MALKAILSNALKINKWSDIQSSLYLFFLLNSLLFNGIFARSSSYTLLAAQAIAGTGHCHISYYMYVAATILFLISKQLNANSLGKWNLATLREESFAVFAFFAQIRKSFFRKKSIIYQPQKFFPQNLRKI